MLLLEDLKVYRLAMDIGECHLLLNRYIKSIGKPPPGKYDQSTNDPNDQ
ncbi:MAG: hypothetical protein ABIR78_09500 [Ferruginibacter sp.]